MWVRNEHSPPLNLVLFSNLGVFEAFDLATIVQGSKKIIVDGMWSFEVGEKRNSTFGHVEFKRNEWSKLHIQCHLQTSPQKKSKLFLLFQGMLLRPSSSQNPPANFTFKTSSVATAVTLSIVFLPPIGDTCKSHVKVHGHSDKMYHQLMATQVKLSKEVSGHRGSSGLYARFTLGVRDQKTCGQL